MSFPIWHTFQSWLFLHQEFTEVNQTGQKRIGEGQQEVQGLVPEIYSCQTTRERSHSGD